MGKFLLSRPADCYNYREERRLVVQLPDQFEWLVIGDVDRINLSV